MYIGLLWVERILTSRTEDRASKPELRLVCVQVGHKDTKLRVGVGSGSGVSIRPYGVSKNIELDWEVDSSPT